MPHIGKNEGQVLHVGMDEYGCVQLAVWGRDAIDGHWAKFIVHVGWRLWREIAQDVDGMRQEYEQPTLTD